jgi:hypothetical protein
MEHDIELCMAVGESADRLLSAQVFMSGGSAEVTNRNITKELYEAARQLQGEPLTSLAAKALLQQIKPGDIVVFASGFFDPPSMVDEGDGPIGAALLARSMCAMLDITPVFLTEVANMGRMESLARAAGLDFADLDLARVTPFKAVMWPLPIDPARAKAQALQCLDTLQPRAIITIEKPASCPRDRYHTGMGLDVTDVVGKINYLIEEARRREILTIGLGDGGNEAGMGKILPTILEVVPTGNVIGTPLETDILVVTSIANWGAYGIEACLAAALHMPQAIHTLADERRVVETAARSGLIDPVSGMANGWVDGTPPVVSECMLELLRQMVELRLLRKQPQSVVNFSKRWALANDADRVVALWAAKLADDEAKYFA